MLKLRQKVWNTFLAYAMVVAPLHMLAASVTAGPAAPGTLPNPAAPDAPPMPPADPGSFLFDDEESTDHSLDALAHAQWHDGQLRRADQIPFDTLVLPTEVRSFVNTQTMLRTALFEDDKEPTGAFAIKPSPRLDEGFYFVSTHLDELIMVTEGRDDSGFVMHLSGDQLDQLWPDRAPDTAQLESLTLVRAVMTAIDTGRSAAVTILRVATFGAESLLVLEAAPTPTLRSNPLPGDGCTINGKPGRLFVQNPCEPPNQWTTVCYLIWQVGSCEAVALDIYDAARNRARADLMSCIADALLDHLACVVFILGLVAGTSLGLSALLILLNAAAATLCVASILADIAQCIATYEQAIAQARQDFMDDLKDCCP